HVTGVQTLLFRSLVVERDQLVDAVASLQVVRDVGVFVADRGEHDAYGCGVAGQGVRHGARVLYARRVPVGDDDDVGASQVLRVLVAPFPAAGATGVARGHQATGDQGVDVFLPFAHVDGAALLGRSDDLRQPVEHSTSVS